MDKTSGGTVTSTKTFYPAGGAMRVDGTRYYVLKDHLGSASVVTNQSATTVGEDRFYPFGETRFTTGNMKTDKLFTGQREMAGLGIYHYNARFYSPKLGRFLSADTIVPGISNPQTLDRYAYVMNNPLRYIDPTGHKCVETGPGECLNDKGKPINGAGGWKPTKKKPRNNGGGSGGSSGGNYCATHIGSCGNPIPLPPQVMNTSTQGENFVMYWEDDHYAQYPYADNGGRGNCTIGWGHFLKKDGCSGWPNKTWHYDKDPNKDRPLSQTEAEDFFNQDIIDAEKIIKRTITADLTQAQFDAMVDYIFNTGGDKFKAKGIPALINSGDFEGAAAAMASGPYDSGGIEFDKLIERRQAEAALFLDGTYVP